jgi:hypothetical protein
MLKILLITRYTEYRYRKNAQISETCEEKGWGHACMAKRKANEEI